MTAVPGPVRRPAVAGQFYPADGGELARTVERCFLDPRGPGQLPARRRAGSRAVRAIVAPHAGYVYSGAIAAHAYAAVAADGPPSTVLVLGVNHTGRGAPAALSAEDWETPLGRVPVDRDLVRALDHPPIARDEVAHAREHSIEVQLPFLQYVLPAPRVVALGVSMGPIGFLADVAAVVTRALQGRDVLVVASTDFSHYVPAGEAERKDARALREVERRRPEALYDVVLRDDISMCGIAPTTVMLLATQDEPLRARILRWGHSGEAEPMEQVVGYASAVLERTDVAAAPPAPADGSSPGEVR